MPENAINPTECLDHREQLFNEGLTGPIAHIQISTERIQQLRGILFDVDPKLLHVSPLLPELPSDPREFFDKVLLRWLSNHPVLAKAEVRCSGTGLHALLMLESPLVFETDGERDRWAGIVEVVQSSLPIDPDQPGITAVTRPVGSINAKNGAEVICLKPADPLEAMEVECLFKDMCERPFATVFQILTGGDSLSPCPLCEEPDSRLTASHVVGNCYGSCGQVPLTRLYDLLFAPAKPTAKEIAR